MTGIRKAAEAMSTLKSTPGKAANHNSSVQKPTAARLKAIVPCGWQLNTYVFELSSFFVRIMRTGNHDMTSLNTTFSVKNLQGRPRRLYRVSISMYVQKPTRLITAAICRRPVVKTTTRMGTIKPSRGRIKYSMWNSRSCPHHEMIRESLPTCPKVCTSGSLTTPFFFPFDLLIARVEKSGLQLLLIAERDADAGEDMTSK
mmetsp:Transcript_24226/g.52502  ORF Transcript_24226/g.52502 Transcript_24226/m.52502 type:complete len:201 (+) Transcript_24226:834-1436(+)